MREAETSQSATGRQQDDRDVIDEVLTERQQIAEWQRKAAAFDKLTSAPSEDWSDWAEEASNE